MMSEKSCLSLKTIKGSLGMWPAGVGGEQETWLFPGVGRSQQVTDPSYTESLTASLDTSQVTGLRKTRQISCHSLWLGREGKGF